MGASVLIVDDEPLLRQMLRLLIERDGRCSVCGEAGDGQEALDLVEARRPDLVLLELEIPVVDGLKVLAELRHRARPEVVVFTGHPSAVARAIALGLGATGFLSKGEQNLPRLLNTLAAASPGRRPARPSHVRHHGKEDPVTEAQRAEIEEILVDLRSEESDQHAERGHASNRLLRAVARLEQLVEPPSTDPGTRPSPHGDASTARI